jgi:hypothetical protein
MPATIQSPYLDAPGAVWLRGNLHTHSSRSDGRASPQEMLDAYARLGYDFLALSDHDLGADYAGLDPRGMLLLPCAEVSAGGGHVLAAGCREKIAPDPERQKVIDAIRAAGGLAVLSHPNWEENFNHYPIEELVRLTGYAGVEIFNGVIHELPGSALATDKWDRLLALGRPVWGFADDDAHSLAAVGRGWNVALARERTAEAALAALAAGSFYASSGVTIAGIAVEGPRLALVAPDAEGIAVIGELGARLAWTEDRQLTFDVSACRSPFFRVECFGRAGRMAWTQPFRIGGEAAERRRQLLGETPILLAGRAARAVGLSGDLAGPAWAQAGSTRRFMDSGTGAAPPVATELQVLLAGGKLLFGLRCQEPHPELMKLNVRADGQPSTWTDDGVELFIAPDGRGARYFHVMANAAGHVYTTERRAPAGTGHAPAAECRVGRDARGWTLELAIPLAELSAQAAPGERWAFNAVRNRHAGPEAAAFIWSFTGGGNHCPERFGWLKF